MNPEERKLVVKSRQQFRRPWHAPPHFEYVGLTTFIVTAACFEHKHIIGVSAERMAECESKLLGLCQSIGASLFAWCILPNHYHLLVQTDTIRLLLAAIGRFHGATSFKWNGEDTTRGRKVWYRCIERSMRSERHFFATLNYIHHNAVKHGYVKTWQEWPYSSAANFIETGGKQTAIEMWRDYPVLNYGDEWDAD